MSLDNNEPRNIQDQVKKLLSELGGETGEFLNKEVPGTGAENWGQAFVIVVSFKCRKCNVMHFGGFSPEQFLEMFAGKNAENYFENFSAIGMFQGQQPSVNQSDIDRLLERAEGWEKANEQLKKHINYVQSLADEATIKNSHLQVENDSLKRELDRLRPTREEPGETALDFPAIKRRVKFFFGIKREGQY
jgi:regulator of replication initiation timing